MLKNSKIKTLRKFKYIIIPGLFKMINKAIFLSFLLHHSYQEHFSESNIQKIRNYLMCFENSLTILESRNFVYMHFVHKIIQNTWNFVSLTTN